MGPQEKIIIREAELGPVIARADHQEGAIEVNTEIFYKLPPMVQEFVLCHEVCHLKHDEWDEARTNQLASELFMQRAKGDRDREERARFLSYLEGNGGYSNFAWGALIAAIPALVSFGVNAYKTIKDRNALWYSWESSTQRANLSTMLSQAFEASRKTSSQSAAQLFWAQMQHYTNKDDDLEQFLGRSDNAWVQQYIRKYEKAYGFGFEEVTPVDITAFPAAMLAIGLLVGFVVYKIIKKLRK